MSDHGPVLDGEILAPEGPARLRPRVKVISYPFLVTLDEVDVRPGESVAALMERIEFDAGRLPTTVRADGAYYLRADWPDLIIDDYGEVAIETTPLDFGGGGNNTGKMVLSIVAAIAIAVVAPYIAGAVFTAGTMAFFALQAAIIIGGNLALSYFMAGKQKKKAEDEQLSALNVGGQRASLGQARHVLYGKMRWAPVLAATDYRDFGAAVRNTIGNVSSADPDSAQKSRTFKLLWITEGTSVIEKIELGRTTVWTSGGGVDPSFTGQIEVEIVEAGDPVTLFPVTTHQATDPSGLELFYDPNDPIIGQRPPNNWLGPFPANPPSTTAYRISMDFVMQAGFQVTNSNGNIKTIPVVVVVEYRAIDNAGAPTGSWTALFTRTYSGGPKPAAFTEEIDITPGRYEIRVRRNSAITADGKPSCQWVALRSVLQGNDTFPGQVVAIKTVAGRQFAQFQSTPFYVTATRVLPTWNGSAWVNTTTRNPVWAGRDILTAAYGAVWSTSKLDSNADLLALANACAGRSETFDYVFTGEVKTAEALSYAMASFRGFWRQILDKISFVRDEAQPIPAHFIPSHRIVDGSIEEEFTYPLPDAVDGIRVEYRDEAAGFEMADVVYPSNAIRPETHQLPGVTNRAIANKIAAYLWLHMTGPARRTVRFQTARDGRFWLRQTRVAISAPQFGEDVAVANVVSYNSGTRTVTVNQQIQWPAGGTFYLELRSKSGGYVGPILCTKGAAANQVVLDATSLGTVEAALAAAGRDETTFLGAVTVPSNAERPIIAISAAGVSSIMITNVEPDGDDRVTVTGIAYDESLYAAADSPTSAPTLPTVTQPTVKVPIITGLSAYYTAAIVGSVLLVSWTPSVDAPGGYRVRLSFDGGVTEGEVYPTSDPVASINVNYPAAVRVRVSGVMVDGSEGPGATVSVAAGDATVQPTGGTVGPGQLDAVLTTQLVDLPRALDFASLDAAVAARVAAAQADVAAAMREGVLDGRIATVTQSVRSLESGTAQSLAQFNETITLVTTSNVAIAVRVTNLETSVGDAGTGLAAAHARITSEQVARSAEDASLAADIVDLQASVVDQTGAAAGAEIRTTQLVAAASVQAIGDLVAEAVNRSDRDKINAMFAGSLDGRVASLSVRIEQIKAESDGSAAGFSEITYALSTAQLAQAAQITSVSAMTSAGTANGKIQFVATSAPGGVDARYQIQVETTTPGVYAFAGLYLDVTGGTSKITMAADKIILEVTGGTNVAPFEVATIGGTPSVRMTTVYVKNYIQSDNYAETGGVPTAGWRLTSAGVLKALGAVLRDADITVADVKSLNLTNPPLVGGVDYADRAAYVYYNGTPSGYGVNLQVNGFVRITPRSVTATMICGQAGAGGTRDFFRPRAETTTLFAGAEFDVNGSVNDVVILNPDGTGTVRTRAAGGTVTDRSLGLIFNPLVLNPWGMEIAAGTKLVCLMGDERFGSPGNDGWVTGRGVYPIIVPAGMLFMDVVGIWGAGGAGGGPGFVGGPGEYRQGKFAVTPGETLWVIIGQGGYAATIGAPPSIGFGGKSYGGTADYLHGGGGLSGVFRGPPTQANALIIAGGGGGGDAGAHGGAGGHASEAGQNGRSGAVEVMRGINAKETNATVTQAGSGGGGGYVGGGNYGSSLTLAAGRGGTGYLIAGATGGSNTVGTRGTVTAPNEAHADWVTPRGRGGAAQTAGNDGMIVYKWTTS